ncbi:MAG: hypothetical protein FWH37_07640 [Candidatus Bathyarchaeota archaeon]|nr:hypothetical protein [Candidatus Termiticorpusculum sp.]
MNKNIFFGVFVFFFISGTLVVAFNPVFASELVEDSWYVKSSMNQSRRGSAVVAVNGKIYAIGGVLDNVLVGTNECYDPKTNTWETLKPASNSTGICAIAAYQNKIYCMYYYDNRTKILNEEPIYDQNTLYTILPGTVWVQKNPTPYIVTEVYDITTDSWSTKASISIYVPRIARANVIGGKIFILSGCDLLMYDPVADSWTTKTSMPQEPLFDVTPFVMDNKLMVVGEFKALNYTVSAKILIYEPHTDKWVEDIATSHVLYGPVGVTSGVYAPQKAYIIAYSVVTNTTYWQIYDPVANTWTNSTNAPYNHIRCDGVVVVDDILYIIGDMRLSLNNVTVINMQYVPVGYISPSIISNFSESKSAEPNTSNDSKLSNFTEPYVVDLFVIVLVAIIVLTVGLITRVYFSKKEKKIVSKTNTNHTYMSPEIGG